MARAFRRIKALNRVKSITREKGIVKVFTLSSFIEYLAYCAKEKLLVVKIRDTCYAYGNVTGRRFKSIVVADSIGKAYNESIKGEHKIELVSSWKE